MQIEPAVDSRQLKTIESECDLVVVGGGLAGVCCAITAARAGIIGHADPGPAGAGRQLVQRGAALGAGRDLAHGQQQPLGTRGRRDRRDSSSRTCTATARATPLIFDTILLEKVTEEPNITLLLNTAVYEVEKSDADTIAARHRLLQPELDQVCGARTALLRRLRRRRGRLPGRGRLPHGRRVAGGVRREVCARRRLRRAARPLHLLLHQGRGHAGALRAAQLRPGRHHQGARATATSTAAPTAAVSGGSSTAGDWTPSTRPRPSSGSCGRWSTASGTTSRIRASFPMPRT